MARFQKGISGNPTGRPKGSTNTLSGSVKESISEFVLQQVENLPELWEQLKPREQARLLCSLLKFIVPIQKEIEQAT